MACFIGAIMKCRCIKRFFNGMEIGHTIYHFVLHKRCDPIAGKETIKRFKMIFLILRKILCVSSLNSAATSC